MSTDSYAYLVGAETSAEPKEFVVVGASAVEAARHAQARVREIYGAEARLVRIELLAPALADAAPARPGASVAPKAEETEPAKATHTSRSGTRVAQLVELLRAQRGKAHLREIAAGLETNNANAQNVIAAAVKRGVVRRVGKRTGVVELVEAVPTAPAAATTKAAATAKTAAPPVTKSGSRAEQVAEALRARGGEAHVTDLADVLGTNVMNARNCVAAAVRRGLVERVGQRSGRVRLVESLAPSDAAAPGAPEAASAVSELAPAEIRPENLKGIQRRVYGALVKLGAPSTAKEIAGVLGCRPREAGNAASILVTRGWAMRSRELQPPEYHLVRKPPRLH